MLKNILRIIIALIFLLSGFVKAIDAVGFSFKLEEYFSPSVFNLPFLESHALLIAIFVVVFELIFGFMLLIKAKLRFTLLTLIGLCIFFAFLTFYSAFYNVVTDCGCFGDALKLTPWQSFWKDIILLFGLIVLYILYRNEFVQEEKKQSLKLSLTSLFLVVMAGIIYWGISHEPLIDFRNYKIGTDLNVEKKKIADDPSEFKTFYSLKNVKTNAVIEIDQDEYVQEKKYWEAGSPWKIDQSKTTSKLTKQGYESEIAKFKPETPDGEDLTNKLLSAPKAVLIFSYKPKEVKRASLLEVESKLNQEKNALVYGISTEAGTFKTIKNAVMDGTAIKTIARSNPFIVVLEKGKIVEKMSAEDYIKQKK